MCTVTFLPRRRGYALAMNRDEQRARAAGLPPAVKMVQGRGVVCPAEPGGGTWIALNDAGVTFALINWYSIKAKVRGEAVSRGKIIPAILGTGSLATAAAMIGRLPLEQTNAFRLIGVFPGERIVAEWRWDLRQLAGLEHSWQARQWISSGHDEPAAQRIRGAAFRRAGRQQSAGTLPWLRRLHRSHWPEPGACSTCMHRADAVTVSCSEVTVSARAGVMWHQQGSPCAKGSASAHRLIRIG